MGTVGNSECFLWRVFQALWKGVGKLLLSFSIPFHRAAVSTTSRQTIVAQLSLGFSLAPVGQPLMTGIDCLRRLVPQSLMGSLAIVKLEISSQVGNS